MRKFKLVNANGNEWDLMRKDGFLYSPDGLGYAKTQEFLRAGNTYIKTKDVLSQKKPSGEMIFSGYDIFREFVSFCAYEPLTLFYSPDDRWYQMVVSVAGLEKTEIEQITNLLRCPIVFTAQSTWFERVTFRSGAAGISAKTYDYQYPYVYKGSAQGAAILTNGSENSPCKLIIDGPAENPQWELRKGSNLITTGKVTRTIDEGEQLVINADPLAMEIAVYDSLSGVRKADAYAQSDFSTGRFIFAPPGQSELLVSADGEDKVSFKVEMERIMYAV